MTQEATELRLPGFQKYVEEKVQAVREEAEDIERRLRIRTEDYAFLLQETPLVSLFCEAARIIRLTDEFPGKFGVEFSDPHLSIAKAQPLKNLSGEFREPVDLTLGWGFHDAPGSEGFSSIQEVWKAVRATIDRDTEGKIVGPMIYHGTDRKILVITEEELLRVVDGALLDPLQEEATRKGTDFNESDPRNRSVRDKLL